MPCLNHETWPVGQQQVRYAEMMIRLFLTALLIFAAVPAAAAPPLFPVRVASAGHLLETADGKPFFWLGDTAWELIHRATPDETRYYLRERARQGFTVIQTVVLAEFDGIRTPTPDGLVPFIDGDINKPNAAYFDRVAWVVSEAGRYGLYVALLPTWGDKLTAPWGDGPRLFPADRPDLARAYGRYLGARLRGRTNIIWMLGGDRPARLNVPGSWFAAEAAKTGLALVTDWRPVWAAMAAGIREGMGAPIVTAYHPQGGGDLSTSVVIGDADWLSINGMQSGHGGGHDVPVWRWIARDYALPHPKPTIDLEPNYEDHPYNPWPQWDPATGRFNDYDVRKQVYRSVLAGGAGVTYGHHAVWQFASARQPVVNFADRDWVSALHRPGAEEMHYLRDLILSRPFFTRVPDQALVPDAGEGALHIVASRDAGGRYAFIYVPQSDQPVTVDLTRLGAGPFVASWYDPRTGAARSLGAVKTGSKALFTSPPHGPDWVLVIDRTDARFGPPGLTRAEGD